MLKHYLKIAIRNLLKYRSQSFISILGLAIGFTCFALGTLWIHYEMTYDSFHKDADRIYLVRQKSILDESGMSNTPRPLAAYLKQTCPEIEIACATTSWTNDIALNGTPYETRILKADSTVMHFFDIKIISGNTNFLIPYNEELAITEALAKKLFGNENPIGKEIEFGADKEKRKICAIVKGWSEHSNIPFGLVCSDSDKKQWTYFSHETYIKLYPKTDFYKFSEKMGKMEIKQDDIKLAPLVVTPLTSLHYDHPQTKTEIKFNHILLFSLAGGLVILCTLFNFLTLFVSRIHMRNRELALRQICGASFKGLLALLSTEFFTLFFIALLVGMVLIELVYPSFKELSEIHSNKTVVFTEALVYIGVIILCSYTLILIVLSYFRHKTLQSSIKGATKGQGNNMFRKVCIIFQLIISIGIIFCSIIMVKQLHYLRNTDIGIERKNIASISIYPYSEKYKQTLTQMPEVTDILTEHGSLLPYRSRISYHIEDWSDKKENDQPISLEVVCGTKSLAQFYNLTLLKGEMIHDSDLSGQVLINEAAAKAFGWNDPIGKSIIQPKDVYQVKGLIKDTYNASPTTPVNPTLYLSPEKYKQLFYNSPQDIIFKYKEESWTTIKKHLESVKKEMKGTYTYIYNATEEYDKYLKSEDALLKMLHFTSAVCIIISIFGVFSLVTLTCEQRKKEIAIRKVNGATTKSILKKFFNEYLFLVAISTAIAFPVGYLAMRYWLESYVKQTEINIWIYPLLFIVIELIIIASVGWKIWKAANQNPAVVVKSE